MLILRLPDDAPANAVLSMSVADGTGQHSDLLVNAPELWWIGPDEVKPGATTSLFGRNLVLGADDHPIVTFEMTSGPNAGQIYTATVTAADGYRVDLVVVPASLPVGNYTVHYANSDAGHVTESPSFGWHRPRCALGHRPQLDRYGPRCHQGFRLRRHCQ